MICSDLVSWVARNQELDVRNYVFQKFLISFALFFDEDIVKLGIDLEYVRKLLQMMVSYYSTKLK